MRAYEHFDNRNYNEFVTSKIQAIFWIAEKSFIRATKTRKSYERSIDAKAKTTTVSQAKIDLIEKKKLISVNEID
jgi:hypothetical protein